jgi:CRISPR type I-E-associated protein CasB/Cse2
VSHYEEVRELGRDVRNRYEKLGPGPCAVLRRCATREELHQEGWFWRLMSDVDATDRGWLAQLVVCFPSAGHREDDRFDLGAHVRRRIYGDVKLDDLVKRGIAFRRLLAARDREDLTHQIRRVLLRAAQPREPRGAVDWGVVGADLKFWSDGVRRRWATGFYTTDVDGDLDHADLEGAIA